MENAAKALLIAGAVLIAILLISITIYIINSSTKPTKEGIAQMSETEISMFNSKFLGYAGKNVSANDVRTLIAKVKASNAQYKDENKTVIITGVDELVEVDNNTTYTVSIEQNSETALVDKITITANGDNGNNGGEVL